MFRVADAQREEGAVGVAADEDMEVRGDKLDRLVPITEAEMSRYGLTAGAMNLAYRCEGPGGKATIVVDRTESRATARTFAFFQVEPDVLRAHYVAIYTIEGAKTRRLALLLPDSTPQSLTIRGLEGVSVKEFTPETVRRRQQGTRRARARSAACGTARAALERAPGPGPPRRGPSGGRFRDASAGEASLPSPSGRGAGGEGSRPCFLRPGDVAPPTGRPAGGEASTPRRPASSNSRILPCRC